MNVKNIVEVHFHSTSSRLTQKDLNHVLGDDKMKLEDIVKAIIRKNIVLKKYIPILLI